MSVEILSPVFAAVSYHSRSRNKLITNHVHECPGCGVYHVIAIAQPFANGAQWTWNSNAHKPTVMPSVHVGPGSRMACHYFLRDGLLQFLPDCHHALAGQTVALPPLSEDTLAMLRWRQ